MNSTEIVVAQVKRMMSDVLELRDQKPEAQSKAIELLKAVANTLIIGRKQASKQASEAPRGFDSDAAEYLYGLKPDIESGGPGEPGGWFGLYLGQLMETPASLPRLDMNNLRQNHGAILHESPEGEVTLQLFPREEDAVDAWEEAIGGNEPELSHP